MFRRTLLGLAGAIAACEAPEPQLASESEPIELSSGYLDATTGTTGSTDDSESAVVPSEPDELELGPEAAPTDEPSAPLASTPLAHRLARGWINIHVEPTDRAPVRGRIATGEVIEVFGYVDGPDCGGVGWADIGYGGYACLELTRSAGARRPPRTVRAVPRHYAKVKGPQDLAPRWSSVAALARGDAPIDHLETGHDYAFPVRRRVGSDIVLVDDRGRAVFEKDVRRMQPSRFRGHDLRNAPLQPDQRLGWVIRWPDAQVHAQPHPDAEIVGTLDYHRELAFEDARLQGGWLELPEGGFIARRDLRLWKPVEPLTDVDPDEVWIDVDLDQQVLTAYRGDMPVFVTLISSGFKGPTPRGVFRIHHKIAEGEMSSRDGASDFYNVEAIPFIQYFLGSYALHGAYWHNRFGHRVSHGCVNLAPFDARTVFQLTEPHGSTSWGEVHESATHLGTTLRIRDGAEVVRDRRGAVEPVYVGVAAG